MPRNGHTLDPFALAGHDLSAANARLSARVADLERERDLLREALLAAQAPTLVALRGYCLALQAERDQLAEALAREIELHERPSKT